MKYIIFITILLLSLSFNATIAQDRGTIAYNNGEYNQAYTYWIRLARNEKNPTAQYNIGILYFKGLGQYKSIDEALRWFERAAKQDHPGASKMIGQIYEEGLIDGSVNYITAKYWYEIASNIGNSYATKKLGDFHKDGNATIINNQKARSYYEKAGSQGYPKNQINELLNSLNKPISKVPESKLEDFNDSITNQKLDDLEKKIDSVMSQSSEIFATKNLVKSSDLKKILNEIILSPNANPNNQEKNENQILEIMDDLNAIQDQIKEININFNEIDALKNNFLLQDTNEDQLKQNDIKITNLSNDLIKISNEIINNNKAFENKFNEINSNINAITKLLSENKAKPSWSNYIFFLVFSAFVLAMILIMKKKLFKPINILKTRSKLNGGQLRKNFEKTMKDKHKS
jgi:hypothetical protein